MCLEQQQFIIMKTKTRRAWDGAKQNGKQMPKNPGTQKLAIKRNKSKETRKTGEWLKESVCTNGAETGTRRSKVHRWKKKVQTHFKIKTQWALEHKGDIVKVMASSQNVKGNRRHWHFVTRTHSVHLNPQIEGTEIVCPQFSGGRFCQVVTRTGSTVVEQSEKGPDLGRVAWGLVGIETKWRPTQPAAVRVEHSRQTSGFFVDPLVDPWFGLVFSTTVITMTQRGKMQMERTGKDCDRRAQLPSRETWSQRMVSSGNPSHAKQKDLLKHVHQKRKKWKRK